MIDFEEKITELYSGVKTDTKQLIPKPDDGPELLENVELEGSSKSSAETAVETTDLVPEPIASAVDQKLTPVAAIHLEASKHAVRSLPVAWSIDCLHGRGSLGGL